MDQAPVWLQEFRQPGPAWRAKPFWAWNGRLERRELLRQVHVLAAMGYGGVFMHSRTGLETEYLGDEWFELINACADEAQLLGLEAWLYDEDRWPSGTAGGLVTLDPAHRLRFVSLRRDPGHLFTWHDHLLAAFAVSLDGLVARDLVRLTPDTARDEYEQRTVITFSVEVQEPSSFYNGQTYVDTMSRAATDRFIELTHERYAARSGSRLGAAITGIFTDEPHRGALMSGFSLANHNAPAMAPWTDALPAEFERRFGYDLIERLPELFLQVDARPVSQVKWHYCELTQSLFEANFLAPIRAWCDEHGLRLTGHALHEDSLTTQVAMLGSLQRFYPYLSDPGIDILTEGNRAYWAVAQLASVAHQLDQPWLLSELDGCTGWQMGFEGHRALGAWQALLGINLRCPHLSWYTMRGQAKRDYPASLAHQSAWWRDYPVVEDYFARLGVALSAGRPLRETLVINPIESIWCQIHVGWANQLTAATPAIARLDQDHADLFGWLSGAQIGFDYGDEGLLAEHAEAGTDAQGAYLRVGQAVYRQAFVPRVLTLRSTTLDLLDAFAQAGGRVVLGGLPPHFVDAAPSVHAKLSARAWQVVDWDRDAVRAALAPGRGPLKIAPATAAEQVLAAVRRLDEGWVVGLVNTNREQPTQVQISFDAGGPVTQLDSTTGKLHTQLASADAEALYWTAELPPGGEGLWLVGVDEIETVPRPLPPTTWHEVQGTLPYRLDEPNVLVLDRCAWRLDDGPWQPATEVLRADRALREDLGWAPRGGEMVQPWYRRGAPLDQAGVVTLRFQFDVDTLPPAGVQLALEPDHCTAVTLNGQALAASPADAGRVCYELPPQHWIDLAFWRYDVPETTLQTGTNTLEVSLAYDETAGLEAAYLLGEFGVRLEGRTAALSCLPEKLALRSVVDQGLPFYSGTIAYRLPDLPAGAVWVDVPAVEGALCRLRRDDQLVRLPWSPRRAVVPAGPGPLEVEVVLTRRNTFGPLHLVPARSDAYGPDHFETSGATWSDEYVLWPAGLLGPIRWARVDDCGAEADN
ncbi:MAG TPA: hypothetical protein DCZ72_03220 [Armatimonadetes bacterium]|nr:hypothetical protein [Armatimonadota bacterium]